ncbi:glycosyltransferase family 4 protein [Patescibacteria group bacterium]|nr:glycosyltransferase family 4 protein [Patescibacteria group bacterium]
MVKKRILLFSYEFPPLGGGVANATKNLLEEFAKSEEIKIDLITSSLRDTYESEKLSENIGIYKVPIGRKSESYYQKQNPFNMLLYIKNSYLQAMDLLRQNSYDLAHFFGYPGAWQGLLLEKKFALPYLISLRGVDVPFYNPRFELIDYLYRPLVKYLWNEAEKVIVNSQGLMGLAKRTNDELDYEIIGNGVNTEFFDSVTEKEKYKKFTVTAGATIMGAKKGLNFLIEAFAKFAKDKKDVELLLIGDGDLKESLEEKAQELKLDKKVSFVGKKDKSWLKEHLPKCHVFCLPSLNEGMSNAVLEAMACGLPIIVTPVGGSKELLGENGFLVAQADSEAIAERLNLLYKDKDLRVAMGKESRKRAVKMSWQKVAEEYLEVYKNL